MEVWFPLEGWFREEVGAWIPHFPCPWREWPLPLNELGVQGPGGRTERTEQGANTTGGHNTVKVVWKTQSCKSSIVVFGGWMHPCCLFSFLLWGKSLKGTAEWVVGTEAYHIQKKRGIRVPFLSSWWCPLGAVLMEEAFLPCLQRTVGLTTLSFSYTSFPSSPPLLPVKTVWSEDTEILLSLSSHAAEFLKLQENPNLANF